MKLKFILAKPATGCYSKFSHWKRYRKQFRSCFRQQEKAKKHKELNGLEKLRFVLKTSFDETEHHQLSMAAMGLMSSPAFLKKLVESNQELAPMYQELIEEGIEDGSIKTEHAKLLAELFVLLTNFWSIPTIYPMTSEETWEKFLMIKEIMDKLGLPVIDDEIVGLCRENA